MHCDGRIPTDTSGRYSSNRCNSNRVMEQEICTTTQHRKMKHNNAVKKKNLRKPEQIPSFFVSFERDVALGDHDANLDRAVATIDAQV